MTNPVVSPYPASYTCDLPADLYSAEQVRRLDRCAIDQYGIDGIVLMKRAGRAAFEYLLDRWPQVESLTVLCGSGNNAGDGYIVAALAAQRRIPVEVLWLSDPEKLQGDALRAYRFTRQEGVIVQPYAAGAQLQGVVVDALLGTGLQGNVRESYQQLIERVNSTDLPVLSLDLPSGLCADRGVALGSAIRATATMTFIGVKQGLVTAQGVAYCGDLLFSDLRVPQAVFDTEVSAAKRLQLNQLLKQLPERPADAHKGHFGHVLLIGGDHGMGGAILMAAESACRMGAGLTSVATHAEHVMALMTRRPEVMASSVRSGQELQSALSKASVVVIGPGLGQSAWSQQMLQAVLATDLPLVLDADALNLVAKSEVAKRANWVLTPHPAEAARLLKCTTEEITSDRYAAVRRLRQRYGGCVLLKGSGSLIATDDDSVSVVAAGNPGMASGGMGDVLSGVIGGLLAQGFEAGYSLQLAAMLHAVAADREADRSGQRGLLASDLVSPMRRLLNGIDPNDFV